MSPITLVPRLEAALEAGKDAYAKCARKARVAALVAEAKKSFAAHVVKFSKSPGFRNATETRRKTLMGEKVKAEGLLLATKIRMILELTDGAVTTQQRPRVRKKVRQQPPTTAELESRLQQRLQKGPQPAGGLVRGNSSNMRVSPKTLGLIHEGNIGEALKQASPSRSDGASVLQILLPKSSELQEERDSSVHLSQAKIVVAAVAAPPMEPYLHETQPAARLPTPPTTPSDATPRTESMRNRRLAGVTAPSPEMQTRPQTSSSSTQSNVLSVPNSPSSRGNDEESESDETNAKTESPQQLETSQVVLPWIDPIDSQEAGSRAAKLSRSSSLELGQATEHDEDSLTHPGGAATRSRLRSAVVLDATLNTIAGREQQKGLQRAHSLKK